MKGRRYQVNKGTTTERGTKTRGLPGGGGGMVQEDFGGHDRQNGHSEIGGRHLRRRNSKVPGRAGRNEYSVQG